jgi:hypothetical protein
MNVYIVVRDWEAESDFEILGVFGTKEAAQNYLYQTVREVFNIEDDVSDEKLIDEISDMGVYYKIEEHVVWGK